MKLLNLTSSNPNFKTINFTSGLNIVVGTQLTKEHKKTINGIGKSMSLNLVHYMFGASFKTPSEKRLKKFLASYGYFILTFSHKNKEYRIKKNFADTDFYINDEKFTQTKYPKQLNKIFFLSENHQPSFKQVFNCFARRYSSEVGYYSNAVTQSGRPLEDYHQRFVNLYLLHLDMALVKASYEIKEELSKLKKIQKSIAEYKTDLDNANINDIKDEIERLTKELNDFCIAPNFDSLKQEADSLTQQLTEYRDEIYFLEQTLARKKQVFQSSNNINIDTKKIEALFQEAHFFFDTKVTKRLDEAQKFHQKLIENRKNRLTTEINEISLNLERLIQHRDEISIKRDKLIKDLSHSGALEERDALKDRITTLQEEQNELEKYERLLNDFKTKQSNLTLEEAKNKAKSINYLNEHKEYLTQIEQKFRTLVKKFYDNKGGSFSIEDNKSAKYLFDINIHVPKESSQGIGEIKIFCYDVLLLLLNLDLLGFLAHDGCIFSEVDPRQQATIFKVIIELLEKHDFQYFINIGDSSLKKILEADILTEQEKEIINNSIRLKLSDKSPKHWLFGEKFD